MDANRKFYPSFRAAILTFDKIMSNIFQSCSFGPDFSVLSFRLFFFWSLAFLGPAHFSGDPDSRLHASVKPLTIDNINVISLPKALHETGFHNVKMISCISEKQETQLSLKSRVSAFITTQQAGAQLMSHYFTAWPGLIRYKLQRGRAMLRDIHWSVSLWRDPDDVPHCRILSPDKLNEWRLISATHTLRMKTMFRGWTVMVHDTHTRRLASVVYYVDRSHVPLQI